MMASRLSKTPFLQAKRQLAQAAVAAKPTDLGGSAQVCRFMGSNRIRMEAPYYALLRFKCVFTPLFRFKLLNQQMV